MKRGAAEAALKQIGEALLSLVCPKRCPLCDRVLKRKEGPVCAACRGELAPVKEPRCMRCSRPLEDARQEYCPACNAGQHLFIQAWAPFVYEKQMRASVLRMKFENRREYIDLYARAMAGLGRPLLRRWAPACILPVPMHPKKRRQRGYDQCLILAKKLGALTGIPVLDGHLVRTRHTLPQKGLTAQERKKNLAGAFALLGPEQIPEPVLLVDDILTTGSTADEICAVLAKSGITRVYVMALTITRVSSAAEADGHFLGTKE